MVQTNGNVDEFNKDITHLNAGMTELQVRSKK